MKNEHVRQIAWCVPVIDNKIWGGVKMKLIRFVTFCVALGMTALMSGAVS
jgi:hypothetical protein